ncbi:MAG: L-lactate dehydrogenase [Firmicutes bacterium]|nr:L-lactate dehydrogenase [Bacillota bacterium]
MGKVVLIGCGNVGMSYAYSLVTTKNKVSELVLIDINHKKAQGEALDLQHAAVYNTTRIKIKAGDYQDCADAKIVCICAGVTQAPGETRPQLLNRNYKVMKSIVNEVVKSGFNGIYLVATNPVDVMTYAVYRLSDAKPSKVIGSGTTLDTSRLRHLIGEVTSIHPKNIHSYVIGEHGDTSMVPWSCSFIGLNKISQFLTEEQCPQIEQQVRDSAYGIIEKKGSTYYGIGICLKDITETILEDSGGIKTICVYSKEHDTCFGMPTILTRRGAIRTLDLDMTQSEREKLNKSIKAIKDMCDQINFD